MLPDGSGLDYLKELRSYSQVPILLLTGLAAREDMIQGLASGGDDYLVKPYYFNVLVAKLEALLRRARNIPQTLTSGELKFDIFAGQACLRGEDLALTPKEFAILLLLAKNERQALAAQYIYETVWKQPFSAEGSALKTVISRLRRKLGEGFFIDNDQIEGSYVFTCIPR
jgi:DNA-binding response OmpR family regulator